MKLLTKIFVSLALCVMMLPAHAQQKRTINGTVMAPDNSPLANASVVVKGNKQGVKSDVNGKFSIEVDAGPQILVVSYVGMKTMEFTITTDATSAAFTLVNDESILSEVVVTTGYQTLPKERATGAFGTVSKEQIEKPSTNISTRIIGTNSGVQALRMDEEGNPFFQIRGLSTLYANQEPLVVVDGFPIQGSYNTVNPNDVESITILKDAAASSIWGSRAVNGVIVITTKKAKKGIPIKVEFNAFTRIGSKIDLNYSRPHATSAEQVEYEKLAFDKWGAQTNAGNLISNNAWTWTPGQLALNEYKLGFISQAQRDKMLDSLKTLNNSQQITDELLANPITQQYNLSLFSASERMNNAVSFMYEKNQSNFQETYNQRFMLNYRALANITKWLDFSLNTMIQHNKYTNNGTSLAEIQSLAPYEMLLDKDGKYTPTTLKYYLPVIARSVPTNLFPYTDWSYNPAREIKSRSLVQKDYNARVQAGLALKIMKGLSIESSIQYEIFNTFNRNLYSENSFTVRQTINQAAFWNPSLPAAMTTSPILNLPKGSILNQSRSENVAWNFRNLLRLDKKYGTKHEVNFVAGTEQQSRVVQGFNHPTTYGYNDATLQVGAFPNGPGGTPVNGNQNGTGTPTTLNIRNWLNTTTSFGYTNSFSYITDRFFSLFGNVAYTFNDKYTLTGSVRSDGANFITDDPKYRYNPFWSVGGSWQMWKEKFMTNVDFVDRLSLRLTYGYNGNQDRSTSFMPLISLGTLPNALTNQFTASFSSLGNPTLRWEKTGTLNFGIDYSIFKGKLFGNINLYKRNGKDLLANIAIPAVNGSTSQFLNNAAMVNKGIEMEFGTTLNITKDLRWSGNMNFSYNKNEITDLFITQYNSSSMVARNTASYAVGYNANTLWMFQYMGFNSSNQPTVLGPGGVNYDMQTFVPGDARTYLDNVGTLVAPYTLGFMNNFDYKNFNLSFIVTGNFGHVFQRRGFNYPVQWSFASRMLANKFVGDVMNGKSSEMLTLPVNPAEPRFFFWDRFYNNFSYLGQSASWLRMQEVNLTYRLPKKALTKTGLNNMQIYAQGNDLFVILANKYSEDPLYALGTLNPRPKFTFGVKCDF